MQVAQLFKTYDLRKLEKGNDISKLGESTGMCLVSPTKINFGQERSKLTQKQIPKFSNIVQFCLIWQNILSLIVLQTESLLITRLSPFKPQYFNIFNNLEGLVKLFMEI